MTTDEDRVLRNSIERCTQGKGHHCHRKLSACPVRPSVTLMFRGHIRCVTSKVITRTINLLGSAP